MLANKIKYPDEVQNLHRGQSFDLYWKYNGHIPSVEKYIIMVDNSMLLALDHSRLLLTGTETGGLFRLCTRNLIISRELLNIGPSPAANG